MSKPVRYVLLLLVLAAAVCLVATAAGYYAAGAASGFFWRMDDSGGKPLFWLSIHRDTELDVRGHEWHLPLPWMGCVLLGLSAGAGACFWGATILMRPLFAGQAEVVNPDPSS